MPARAGAGADRRATAAAVLDFMASLAGTSSRRHSVQLVRDRLQLSADEEAALRAFQSPPRQPAAGRTAESVAAAVLEAAEGLGLTEQEAARLTAGLTAVGASRFTVTDSNPAVAVLTAVDVVDPYPLLDVVADPELGVALDLGLSSLPPGHWSIPALIAATLYAARSRRPVGEQLLAATDMGSGA